VAKADTWENGLLLLVYNNTAFTGLGDAGGLLGSAAAGSIFESLHTADPGEGGTQSTNETTYTNYTRVGVARSGAGWTVTGNAVENAAAITFPTCGATGATLTHLGIGTESSGAGKLMYHGALTASLIVNSGVTPEYVAGALDLTES
jgi:hypothetical protein